MGVSFKRKENRHMPAPVTASDFLDLVAKSGVLEKPALDEYLGKLNAPPENPRDWADRLVADRLLTPFQAKHILAGRYKGLIIGQYKLLEQIGKGGTGVVFLAEHTRLRRQVALKILPADRSRDYEALERFYREARAVAGLDHPNIVRAHDANHTGNLHYLVMEYVDGVSLQTYIQKQGPVPFGQAAHFISQAAAGLQHAFENGMVHRDIKPGNLLLDKTGVLKVLDMGLVRFFLDRDDGLTQDYSKGAVLGTADYLSPEQAMNCHQVDIRADIYSLGATFYALLAGRPPFHGERLTQKLMSHQLKEPIPLNQFNPEIPREISDVVRKMMAKRPQERYQTPAEVMEALAPWASSLTSTLAETSLREQGTQKVPGKADELVRELASLKETAPTLTTAASIPSLGLRNRHKELLMAAVALSMAVMAGAGLCWWLVAH
jgi:serine/threonine protein kinase